MKLLVFLFKVRSFTSRCRKHKWHFRFFFFIKKHCVLDDSPGSACDGQTDERVLVRQPFCSTHCSAGQENCVPAVRHQGRQRLDRLVALQIGAGAGTGATRPTERLSEGDGDETSLCNCLRLPSAGHNPTVHPQRADSVFFGAKVLK